MKKTVKYNFHFDNSYGVNPIRTHYFDLFQVGDLFLSPNTQVPEHKQYCFEISFVSQGNGIIYANGHKYFVKKDDLQFSFLGEPHTLQADEQTPFRFFYIALNPVPNTICESIIGSLQKYSLQNDCIFAFPNIFDRVKDLLVEIYNKDVFFEKKVEAIIMDILISIFREVTDIKTEKRTEDPLRKDVIIYNIVNYINSSNKLITLKDISTKFFYDYNYISRNFKQFMGVGLRDYLYDIRLDKAKHLLDSTDKSVTEISTLLGYSCIHSFSRSFKNKFGLSPQSYKENTLPNDATDAHQGKI